MAAETGIPQAGHLQRRRLQMGKCAKPLLQEERSLSLTLASAGARGNKAQNLLLTCSWRCQDPRIYYENLVVQILSGVSYWKDQKER